MLMPIFTIQIFKSDQMKLKNIFPFLFLMLYLTGKSQKLPSEYVNTFIGTGGHGHTYPGATVPFGMVQLSPDTRLEGWDGCGGYHYDDSYIYGFSHTHLNGTGVPDLCDILIMPGTGDDIWNNGSNGKLGYGSNFSHEDESAAPGYYRVLLKDNHILAELSATTRAGMHRYTFPKSQNAKILFDLFHRDEVLESSLKIVSNVRIEGMRRSRSWANDQYIYFVAEFSKPFTSHQIAINDMAKIGASFAKNEKNIKAIFHFVTSPKEQILVKVGISAVSSEGAGLNLKKEIPGWDFEKVVNDAKIIWNQELSKISVEGGSEEKKTVFYSALYHTMVNPNTFTDVDGRYRGRDLNPSCKLVNTTY